MLLLPAAFLLVGLLSPVPARADQSEAGTDPQRLLAIGEPATDAIDLQVWTDQDEGSLKPGEPVEVHLKSSRDAYVIAVYVSSTGNVILLFPNRDTQDNHVRAGKEYKLFGKDSAVQISVSETRPEARIAFYVSSKPFDLEHLQVGEDRGVTIIPGSSDQQISSFEKKISELSGREGFNRVLLSLKSKRSLRLMGLPEATTTSRKPEGVTGVQGAHEKIDPNQ